MQSAGATASSDSAINFVFDVLGQLTSGKDELCLPSATPVKIVIELLNRFIPGFSIDVSQAAGDQASPPSSP